MELKKLTEAELETMNYDDIAYHILNEEKQKMKINVLFKKVCDILSLNEEEFKDKIADDEDEDENILEDLEDELDEIDETNDDEDKDIFYDTDADDDLQDDDLEDLVVINIDDEDEENN